MQGMLCLQDGTNKIGYLFQMQQTYGMINAMDVSSAPHAILMLHTMCIKTDLQCDR